MFKGDKRWIAAGLLAVAAGTGGLVLHHRRSEQAMRQRAAGGPTSRGLAALDASAPSWPAPETKEQVAAEITRALAAWRQAILVRDADTVSALDRAFLGAPDRYRGALEASAKTETDERVRAFSTRELGKYKNPAYAPLFEGLLADESPF